MKVIASVDEAVQAIGEELGVSDWKQIEQSRDHRCRPPIQRGRRLGRHRDVKGR
jgi:hypothetical protein